MREFFKYTYPNKDKVEYTVTVFECEDTLSSEGPTDKETVELKYFSQAEFPGLELPFPINLLYPKR